MSKIKNSGLDLYGKVLSFNGIGGERVDNTDIYLGYNRQAYSNCVSYNYEIQDVTKQYSCKLSRIS